MSTWRRGSLRGGILTGIGALVAVIMLVIYLVNRPPPKPPGPPPSGQVTLAPITVGMDPWQLVTAPRGMGDGAPDANATIERYRAKSAQIIADRRADRSKANDKELRGVIDEVWDRFNSKNGGVDPNATLPFTCAADLLNAADKNEFHYEKFIPKSSLEYCPPYGLLFAMEYVGRSALLEGQQAAAKGDKDRAERIYRAVLIYGIRLTEVHVRVGIQVEGFNAQKLAADCLAELWNKSEPDKDKAKLAQQYARAAYQAWSASTRVSGMLFAATNNWNAGDMIYIAEGHKDAAWKVEATLTLGMMMHNKSKSRYGEHIKRCIDEMGANKDPFVAAAGQWAQELTLEASKDQIIKKTQ